MKKIDGKSKAQRIWKKWSTLLGNEYETTLFAISLSVPVHGNTLILFQYVEKHGKPLYDEIVEKANDGRKVYFCLWRNRDK